METPAGRLPRVVRAGFALLTLLALAAVLAGCGGGDSSVARAAPSHPSSSPEGELRRYLASMRRPERRFDLLVERVARTFDGIDVARPGAAWTRASDRLATLTARIDELGDRISQVRAPGSLQSVHEGLAEATTAFGGYVGNVERALRSRVPATLVTAATADTSPIKNARTAWLKAVRKRCSKLDVMPPVWVVPSPAA